MQDDELIAGCLNGSNHHFNELYEKYAYSLYGICLRYSKDKDEAKDVLQDGFIKVFTQWKTFDINKGSFEGWLKRIFVNQAIDCYRKKKILLNSLPAEDLSDELPNDYDNEEYEFDFSQEELRGMIQQLPDGYRTVFNMFVIENMGHKEIASMLGISENTSKTQFFKSRKLLREKINQHLLLHQRELK
ncbi:MAG: sigma-70 family RNA polymerase sigma factor [Bacteroidota bacterium]